ncbi:hypothetical protein ACVR1I_00415 [Streptococcus cameli]
MKKLLNFGNAIFFTMAIHWLYFAFRYAFEFVSINLLTFSKNTALFVCFLSVFIFILYFFKNTIWKWWIGLYQLVISHKGWTLAVLTVFQLFLLMMTGGLARADTTILYQIATDPNFAKDTLYISNNPNNFLFLIYLKLVRLLSPGNFLFILSLLNIFFINTSLVLTYRLVKRYFTERVSNIYFVLYLVLFALQPQYIYTYTDPITLFFIVLFCIALEFLIQHWMSLKHFVLTSGILGILVNICYNLRPPTFIYIIALLIVVSITKRNKQFLFRKIATAVLIASCFFGISSITLNTVLEKQDFVHYDDNYSRSMLYYVNLGLTYGGNYHHELPPEVVSATEDELDELVMKDIQRRMTEYDTASFIGHLYYKYYWITGEGMFGWYQEQVMVEENKMQMPWIQPIINSTFAKTIRSVVYASGANFKLEGMFFQLIWILTVFGIVVYSYLFRSSQLNVALWLQITLFGGFLFLMIFEGGRTRYLIQFLPCIVLLSSLGWEQFLSFCAYRDACNDQAQENG